MNVQDVIWDIEFVLKRVAAMRKTIVTHRLNRKLNDPPYNEEDMLQSVEVLRLAMLEWKRTLTTL